MRPAPLWSLVGSVVALAAAVAMGCGASTPEFADVCEEATWRIERCGATAPVLADEPCTGAAKMISRCVVEHAANCEELASLMRHADLCLSDGGYDLIEPLEDLPVPAAADAGEDAGLPDGGGGPFYVRDVVAQDETRTYETGLLPAGVYQVSLRGTGNADLYVRRTTAPTSASFDCGPQDQTTNESCTATLTTPSTLHVMVRGVAAQSLFTLQITEG